MLELKVYDDIRYPSCVDPYTEFFFNNFEYKDIIEEKEAWEKDGYRCEIWMLQEI